MIASAICLVALLAEPADGGARRPAFAEGFGEARRSALRARRRHPGPRSAADIQAAERAGPDGPGALATLHAALAGPDPVRQALAARALGRFEQPTFVSALLTMLNARSAEVRSEAVNAIGQSFHGATGEPRSAILPTRDALVQRLRSEPDAGVRSIILATLGRLPYADEALVGEVEKVLVDSLALPAESTGAARGLEWLLRVHAKTHRPAENTLGALRAVVTTWGPALAGPSTGRDRPALSRRLALSALLPSASVGEQAIDRALRDPDPQVRRLAVLAARAELSAHALAAAIGRALDDPAQMVRYEALRSARGKLGDAGCTMARGAALRDASTHVRLLAIDLVGTECVVQSWRPASPRQGSGQAAGPVALLEKGVQSWRPASPLRRRLRRGSPKRAARAKAAAGPAASKTAGWHASAHSLVALARLSPDAARPHIARLAADPVWHVRMYAARAAARAHGGVSPSKHASEMVDALEALARDPNHNVAEAALDGLSRAGNRAADEAAIEALGRADYQLLITAARVLQGTPARERAKPALAAALKRVIGDARDTSRDARLALLERLRELENGVGFDFPEPGWAVSAPENRTRPHFYRAARVTMARGGSFRISLHPDEAPATVARFARLARRGYYNGLSFHRVEPNFVIQGGSPGANEYAGDAPFMRDEVGRRPHLRGSVGISTRGRHTGDAQLFIDLIDLPRLDHTYTVFGDVSAAGMAVVDAILEGDVIERIEMLPR